MTYEEFKRELYRCVSEQNFNVLGQDDGKTGQVRLLEKESLGKIVREDQLCVQWGRPEPVNKKNWNIRLLYERFKREGWQGILPEIMGKSCLVYEKDTAGWSEENNYMVCSEQLILRPINYILNREDLSDCFYWRFGDIALVLYAQLGDIGRDYVTMKIRRPMAEKWDVTPEKMLTNALLNSYAKMPPRLFLAGDIRFSYPWEDGVFMPREPGKQVELVPENALEGIRGYRLTTTKMKNGAIALFYPGVQARLAELLKGDYLVGFTSIHEAVIHPVCHKNPDEMKAAIRHINAVFDERDMLTNAVFRYCCQKEKMIEI